MGRFGNGVRCMGPGVDQKLGRKHCRQAQDYPTIPSISTQTRVACSGRHVECKKAAHWSDFTSLECGAITDMHSNTTTLSQHGPNIVYKSTQTLLQQQQRPASFSLKGLSSPATSIPSLPTSSSLAGCLPTRTSCSLL